MSDLDGQFSISPFQIVAILLWVGAILAFISLFDIPSWVAIFASSFGTVLILRLTRNRNKLKKF